MPSARLEPVSLQIDDPFTKMDLTFSLVRCPAASPRPDPLKKVENTVAQLIKTSPAFWDMSQVEAVMEAFQFLEGNLADEDRRIFSQKLRQFVEEAWMDFYVEKETVDQLSSDLTSDVPVFDDYHVRYAFLKERQEQDQQRLQELESGYAKIRELQMELSRMKAVCEDLLHDATQFREWFPREQSKLDAEKKCLMARYEEMRKQHEDIFRHQNHIDKICSTWLAKSEARLARFLR
ncbi:hypothetical protein M5689_019118 [Euphorbia peplus]|nr:hypothetical protein M5689_019118 [Euphorbia peplus]